MAALLVAHGGPGFYFRVIEEGEVEAGDEITQVAAGPERMTVAEVNALLYLPGHPKSELEKALRIPGLSTGWRDSFRALLARAQTGEAITGNSGLTPMAGPPPAWAGFRPLRVSEKEAREQQCHVADPRACRRTPLEGCFARTVCRPAVTSGAR